MLARLAICLTLSLSLPLTVVSAQDQEKDAYRQRVAALVGVLLDGTPNERLVAEKELLGLAPEALTALAERRERLRYADRALSRALDKLQAGAGQAWDEEPHWVLAKYREARQKFRERDFFGALKQVDAILVLEPFPALRQELIALRRQTYQMVMQEGLVSARLEPVKTVLAPGEALLVRLRLTNKSGAPITIAKDPEEWQFGTVVVAYEAFLPGGQWLSRQFMRRVDLASDIELEPGASWERLLSLELDTSLPEGEAMLQRVTAKGTLRPHRMTSQDGSAVAEFLPLLPERMLVAPEQAHTVLAAPMAVVAPELRRLERDPAQYQLDSKGYQRLFYAGLALEESDEEEVIERLIVSLHRVRPSTARRLMGLLAQITRRFPDMQVPAWQAWWRERR